MSWMQTRDGHKIDLLRPDLSLITIEEIAHALSRIGRFAGHTHGTFAYSVAQHSVLVSRRCPPDNALLGLMHDAHEAFLGDITSPVKMALRALNGGSALETLDMGLMQAVRERFYVGLPTHDVKVADLRALATERRDLLGPEASPWNLKVDGKPCEPWDDEPRIEPQSPAEAYRKFLDRFDMLTGRHGH